MPDPLLEISQLTVNLKKRREILKVVDNLSLCVYPGEILGLVGESGAGKSMTGSAIIGLIDAPLYVASGEIRYKQKRIDQDAKSVRGHEISMIFRTLSSASTLCAASVPSWWKQSEHMSISQKQKLLSVPKNYWQRSALILNVSMLTPIHFQGDASAGGHCACACARTLTHHCG